MGFVKDAVTKAIRPEQQNAPLHAEAKSFDQGKGGLIFANVPAENIIATLSTNRPIDPNKVKSFKSEILKTKQIKPIIATKVNNSSLVHIEDGHHRAIALQQLNAPEIPTYVVDPAVHDPFNDSGQVFTTLYKKSKLKALVALPPKTLGGAGSGNYDHEGRPGEVGGSGPGNSFKIGDQVSALRNFGTSGQKSENVFGTIQGTDVDENGQNIFRIEYQTSRGEIKSAWIPQKNISSSDGSSFQVPPELLKGLDSDQAIKINLPLDQITLAKRSGEGAARNISSGRPSKTKGPIDVFYDTQYKQFLVVDGVHRVIAANQSGKEIIPANVWSGSYSDYRPVYSNEEKYPLGKNKNG